jgi:aryl-alcohol dehydrogenase-like predicted oxidoreductase
MKRRNLIATSVALPLAAAETKLDNVEIPKRVFGKTGEKLTVIGQAGGRFGMVSFEEAVAVTRHAVELGVNYFDCAHTYWGGRSEEVYGQVLPAARKKVFITTKSDKRDKAGARAELELSLKRMKTDYVDLWQIHAVGEMEEVDRIFGPGGAIEAFEEAKKQGLCRFIGFTGHRDPRVHLEMLKRYDKYDTILMPLHPAEPAYLSFEKDVLPVAVQKGLGIQGMKSTANAKLLQRFSVRECIQYVLSLPVHCLALGCTTVGQIEDDVRVAKALQALPVEKLAELRARATRFQLQGPQLEDWKKDVTKQAGNRVPYIGG